MPCVTRRPGSVDPKSDESAGQQVVIKLVTHVVWVRPMLKRPRALRPQVPRPTASLRAHAWTRGSGSHLVGLPPNKSSIFRPAGSGLDLQVSLDYVGALKKEEHRILMSLKLSEMPVKEQPM